MSPALRIRVVLRRLSPVVVATAVAAVAALAGAVAAIALWSASGGGPANGGADTMPRGSAPAVHASGSSVTLSWAASSLQPAGPQVSGYVINRYDASNSGGGPITPGAGCAGVVNATSCTENSVPAGNWQYTVIPVLRNWHGGESPPSTTINVNTKTATTTSLASSGSPSVYGAAVTFTATVSPASGGSGTPTGSATLSVDGTAGAPISLDGSGKAAFTTSALAVGTHSITAAYSGDSSFTASTSSALSQQVSRASTTTAVNSSANPSTYGQSVTFTVSVAAAAPGSGTPTGTVTLSDGGTQIASGTLSGGSFSYATSALAGGSHAITAQYAGDTNFNGGSAGVTQQVNAASTSTSLASSVNPSVFGQGVTFTATVSSAAGTPAGSVNFTVDSASVTAAVNANGIATYTTSGLALGAHTVSAAYAGSGSYGASTSAALTQTVKQAASATTVSSSANPSATGQSVTFTITVAAVAPGAGTPTGTVTLSDGGTQIASGTLSGGSFAYSTSALGGGSHTITAQYGGDTNFTASSGGVTQQVNAAATSTSVASSANPSVFGQSVTFTATVSSTAGTPAGSVTFNIDSMSVTATLNAAGSATYTLSTLTPGGHTVTASYAGGSNFGASTSGALAQQVNQAATTTALTSSPNPSSPGQSVTFTTTVTAVAPGAGTPTGTVTLTDSGAQIGSGALTGGVFSFTTSSLSGGNHDVVATYGGDPDFTGGVSNHVAQSVVAGNGSVTNLTASPVAAAQGQPVTLTAQVSPATTSTSTPTGTVTFSDGATAVASVGLDSTGKASYTTSNLSNGLHTFTAAYGGDGNFGPSTSSPATVTIGTGCTINWTGRNSTAWNDSGNWQDAQGAQRLPGPGDRTCLGQTNQTINFSSGTTSILSLVTSDGLNLSGGELDLTDTTFDSQLNGPFTQAAGSVLGGAANVHLNSGATLAGGTQKDGSTTIAAGVNVNVTGPVTLSNGRVVSNAGTVTDSADFSVDSSTTVAPLINNLAGGVWQLTSASTAPQFYNAGSNVNGTFNNAGSFRMEGANQLNFGWVLENAGTLSVDAGTLNLIGGDGGVNGGSYTVAASATLEFSTAAYNFPAADTGISGAGTVALSDASVTIACPFTPSGIAVSGGTLTLNENTSFSSVNLSLGTINGTGTMTVTGTGATISWSGGSIALNTIIDVGATLNASGTPVIANGVIVTNKGTVNDSATNFETDFGGPDSISNVGTWNAGASWNLSFPSFTTTPSTFVNSGTVNKNSADVVNVSWIFENTGAVNVLAGKLNLNGGDGGTDSGSYAVSSGATLELAGGTFHFTGTAGVTGAGTGLFDQSLTKATFDAPYSLNNLTLPAGQVVLNAGSVAGSTLATISVSGFATLSLNTAVNPITVTETGNINGNGSIKVTGPGATMNWGGGRLGVRTTIDVGSTLNISGSQVTMSQATTLTNNGTTNETAATLTTDGTPATINNNAVWNAGASANIKLSIPLGSNQSTFNNSGTLTKTNSDTFNFSSWNLNNSGTVNVVQGILQLSGSYAPAAGATSAFTIGGTTAGTGYGQLQANAYALAGTLTVSNASGFAPASGSTYQLITCSGSTTCGAGAFTTVNVPPAYVNPPTYDATDVTLKAA